MRFSMAFLASSVFAVTVAAASSTFAQRVVVFGDSLSDTGNAAALTSNFTPGSPSLRYSNGLNWVDQLYGTTAAFYGTGIITGNVDLAIGGARTDTFAAFPFQRGIPTQISDFIGSGGTFGPKDTVTVWGGANNIFQYFAVAGAGATQAGITNTAISAAASEVSAIQTVVAAGAKTIVVLNLPNIGATPAFVNTPGSAGGTLGSSTFNSALATGLGQVAAGVPGVNIIQADIGNLFKVAIANASAFGFTNTTGFCGFNGGAACKGFVFADSVHPTEAAYALVAAYVGLLSNTAPALQQTSRLGETGLYVNEIVTNQVFDRMSAFISGTYADRNGPFAEIIGSFGSYEGSAGTPGLSMHLGGVRVGLDKKSGATLTGGSVTMLAGGVSTGSTKSDITSYRADMYTTALFGNGYVSADAGISSLSLEGITRETGFPTATASGSTGGYVASVAAEAGYVATMGNFTIIPSARLTYFHSKIDGYSEAADLLAMTYNERETDAVLAGGKVRVVTPVSGFGRAATVFGEVGYEGFISTSTNKLTGQLVNNTALPTTINAGSPSGPGVTGKMGMSSQISEGTFLDFHYGLSVHDGGGETHSGDIRLKATY